MKIFFVVTTFACLAGIVQASQYQPAKAYNSKSILSSDDSKIKSCLKSLYASQIRFRKSNGYFTALPDDLKLTRYKVCDGLEISTHLVTEDEFKMTAKFNHKIWSVDENKNIQPQIRD